MTTFKTLFSQHEGNMRIEVKQLNNRRQLVFDGSIIQSEIDLDQPTHLALNLHEYFLAGHLFATNPKRVLLAGLGGGALARYFINRFPDIKGDAVEISPLVCQLAQEFFEFPKTSHWRIHQQSIQDYVAQHEQQYDCIIVDIADGLNTPSWLMTHEFLSQLKNKLSPQGHIAFNLLSKDIHLITNSIQAIRQNFKGTTACLAVPNTNNVVVYAYREKPVYSSDDVTMRLKPLSQRWALPFQQFHQEMQNSNPKGSGIF